MQCIEESLEDFRSQLDPCFRIRLEKDAMKNPLYAATEKAEEDLLLCPDLITNTTQVIPLHSHAGTNGLFYVLEYKGAGAVSSAVEEKSSKKRRKTSKE